MNKKYISIALIAFISIGSEDFVLASSWWGSTPVKETDEQFIARMQKEIVNAQDATSDNFEYLNYLDTPSTKLSESPFDEGLSESEFNERLNNRLIESEFNKIKRQGLEKIAQREIQDKNKEKQLYKKSIDINQSELVKSYIGNDDILLQHAEKFWEKYKNRIVKLLEHQPSIISTRDYEMIQQACVLGKAMEQHYLLELFDTNYNVLNVIVGNIKSIQDGNKINNQTSLQQVKNDSQSFIKSLLETHRNQQSFELELVNQEENITRLKHKLLETNNALLRRIAPNKSISDYLSSKDKNIKHTLKRNLQNYKSISDVRGEGNCGYRAFLGSVYMNGVALGNFEGVNQLQRITENQFTTLFSKYAGQNNNQLKLSVFDKQVELTSNEIESIKNSMIRKFETIKAARTFDDVARIFNDNVEFDFYMIMFLRTLISEEFLKDADLKYMAIMARSDELRSEDETKYLNHQLAFRTWIDNAELTALNRATNIDISLINEDAISNSEVDIRSNQSNQVEQALQANISFSASEGHYKILHPKFDK
ncbi:MAG: hypothetical protein JO129_01260 [Candidatus Dependentiae bacterium]|nr:hypothetical protein [Candidatus Dependentiae bacterium]